MKNCILLLKYHEEFGFKKPTCISERNAFNLDPERAAKLVESLPYGTSPEEIREYLFPVML